MPSAASCETGVVGGGHVNLLSMTTGMRQAERLGEILRVVARHGWADWLSRVPSPELRKLLAGSQADAMAGVPAAERFRLMLTELGTTFIKFGQVLSTRSDLLAPAIIEELRMLQADTPADPFDVVRETIREDLGKEPTELFAEFEPEAFSSASIGQVHRARLPGGQEVVVKVQHEGIEAKVRLDLELLQQLALQIQTHVPDSRPFQPVVTTREFSRTLLKELDFRAERRHMELFAHNFAKDETVHIPAVHAEACGRRVLTMELLSGISGARPAELREAGADLDLFAQRAANVFLNMIFRDGFYHADPHPGNFLLLDGEVLGLLDSGMVGRLDDSLREVCEELLLCMLQNDSEGLADLLLRVGSAPAGVDRGAFRSEVGDLLLDHGTRSIAEFDLAVMIDEMTGIVRRHQILMPSSVSLLLKTLVVLQGTARLLSPTFALGELLEPFKQQLIRQRLDPRRWLRKLQHSLRDVDRLVTHAPGNLADILDRMRTGTLRMRHEHANLEAVANRLVEGVLIASLFLGSSLLLGGAFPPQWFGVSVVGGLGFLVAALLGGRLLRTIARERRGG